MQGVYFDEVRRMEPGDVERALERTSAQVQARKLFVSTAYYPESDIHRLFLQGDQRWFHTACECPDGIVLSRRFPDCIEDLRLASAERKAEVRAVFEAAGVPYLGMTDAERQEYGEACYRCPDCGTVITNPRDGWWEAEAPDHYAHSYQLPQLLSPTYPAARVLHKFEQSQDIQEFWNSTLGLPYVDPESMPVTLEHLQACQDPALDWYANLAPEERARRAVNTVLGADQQAGYAIVVIKRLNDRGLYETIHLEVATGTTDRPDDPWARLAELMHEYDVRMAVVDGEPHWNEAERFAKAFPGRVWTADEVDGTNGETVTWHDVSRKKSQRGETRHRYRVTIHRTKGLRWSLGRWRLRLNRTPPATDLVAILPQSNGRVVLSSGLRSGRPAPTAICRDVYWLHQTRVAFKKVYSTEEAERQGRYQYRAEHVGIDPHFAHANLFADVALARMGRPATIRRL